MFFWGRVIICLYVHRTYASINMHCFVYPEHQECILPTVNKLLPYKLRDAVRWELLIVINAPP